MVIRFILQRPPPVDETRFLGEGINYVTLELVRQVPQVNRLYTEAEWEEIRKLAIYTCFYQFPIFALGKFAPMAQATCSVPFLTYASCALCPTWPSWPSQH